MTGFGAVELEVLTYRSDLNLVRFAFSELKRGKRVLTYGRALRLNGIISRSTRDKAWSFTEYGLSLVRQVEQENSL